MTRQHAIPDDFPKEPSPGVVTGAQPKLLVREKDGRYYTGLTDDELQTHYEVCEDLARQLSAYTSRKMLKSGWSFVDVFAKVERSVNGKVNAREWDFSPAEITWVIKRTRELLAPSTSDGGFHHDR
ncbi:hypothetical protein PQR66_19030 [Paraburkholderia agricolaris]|uniref:Uncharacterized protein n=1 Tax=Paraburkholderia agricolaris TaxID=2152888 RepID=A0ABW8ZPI3_9BURK